jgi:hypothetical protein
MPRPHAMLSSGNFGAELGLAEPDELAKADRRFGFGLAEHRHA